MITLLSIFSCRADSVAWDFHKITVVPQQCSAILLKRKVTMTFLFFLVDFFRVYWHLAIQLKPVISSKRTNRTMILATILVTSLSNVDELMMYLNFG